MSDILKCPYCQQELEKRHAATTDYNSMFITYYCRNPECESTTDLVGCKEFWDILGQLIRTRKALDVALDKLKRIQKIYTNAPFNAPINYANVCTDMYDVATEQIKELDNE